MRIFVIEPTRDGIDLSPLVSLGEVKFIFLSRQRNVFNVEQFAEAIVDRLRSEKFDQQYDAVCIVGGLIANVLMITTLVLAFDKVNTLMFSAADGRYIVRCLEKQRLLKCLTRGQARLQEQGTGT